MLYIVLRIVAVAAAVQGLEVKGEAEINLSTPRIYGLSNFKLNETMIHWLPVDNEGDEPVLGYKVKIWEVGCVKKRSYKTIGGKTIPVEEHVMPRLRDVSTLHSMKVLTVEGVKNSLVVLKNLTEDVPYHVVVAAYSVSGLGPQSVPFRFQLTGRYKCTQ